MGDTDELLSQMIRRYYRGPAFPPRKRDYRNGTRVEVVCEGKITRGYVCARGGAIDPHNPMYTLWVSPHPPTGHFPEPESRGYPELCVRALSLLELIAEAAA
jgi:hypothetical protein